MNLARRIFTVLIIVISTPIFGQINTDELFIYLPFNNTYDDISGFNNSPTNVQTSFAIDRFNCPNSAIYFNGNSYLTFPNQARFKPLSSITVSFWLKTIQTNRFDLIIQRTGSHHPDKDNFTVVFNHDLYGNEWAYPHYTELNTVLIDIPIPNFNNGEWHHFAYVKDVAANQMLAYYDGSLVSFKTITDVYFNINGNLTVGKWINNYFNGYFDDFLVYNRALNSYEIQTLFNDCSATCLGIDLGSDTSYCDSFTQTLNAGNQYPHYLWNTGETTQSITVSSPGTYWVEGYFENGCNSIDSINIALFSESEINLGQDIILCNGESKILKCGDCFQSYIWSTGDTCSSISVNESGYYWVKAINFSNDTIFDEVNITIIPEIEFNLGEDKYICPKDPIVEIKAEEGFSNYLWNTGQSEESILVSEGKYWVLVTDQNSCTASDTIQVISYSDKITYTLYPNPASNYLTIDINTFCFPKNPILLEVFDMNQRIILCQEIFNNLVQIQIPYEIEEAPYIVKLSNGKQIFVKKLIIKKSLY